MPASGGDSLSARTAKRSPAREQVTLEFPDNQCLAALGGAHQKHLVRVEQRLGVRVAMRGNLVAIEGEPESRERAAAVLRALYARLEGGENVALADVDAEIRFALHEPDTVAAAEFGAPSIKTAASRVARA